MTKSHSYPPVRLVVSDFQNKLESDSELIVLLVEKTSVAPRVSRTLKALGSPLIACQSVASAQQVFATERVALCVYQPEDTSNPQAFANARVLSQSAPVILLVDTPEHPWFTDVLAQVATTQSVASLIGAWVDSDLLRTARKILERDAFGVEKYLNWGTAVHTQTLRCSANKASTLDEFAKYLAGLRCSEHLRMRAVTVADEYLMNALYDAPVNADGQHVYSHVSRTTEVELSHDKTVSFEYGSDGQNLVFGCRDPFGSFDVQKCMRSLGRCFRGEDDQVTPGTGGAGIGLYVTYHYVDHLVINLAPGASTEMLAVMALTTHSGVHKGKSVNFFVTPAPDQPGSQHA